MPNRHTNKKRRARIRQRMAETGETYQQALSGLLRGEAEHRRGGTVESTSSAQHSSAGGGVKSTAPARRGSWDAAVESTSSARRGARESRDDKVDLVVACYFGWPITLAVYEASEPVGVPIILRVPSATGWSPELRTPVPILSFRRCAQGEAWQ
jgi:hypothetical protein